MSRTSFNCAQITKRSAVEVAPKSWYVRTSDDSCKKYMFLLSSNATPYLVADMYLLG